MSLESLLYISECTIPAAHAQSEVSRILATAHAKNPSAGITGALVFTGTHFAQVIEGTTAAVDDLIASIERDPRHTQVHIVTRDVLSERRFPDWSMAYNGPSQFVSLHVTRLLNDPSLTNNSRAAEWLAELLEQFAGFKAIPAKNKTP